MNEDKEELHFNLRYSQRLCQRSARLYRRVQTTLTFSSLLAGSSAVATLAAQLPPSLPGCSRHLQCLAA